VVGAGKVAKTLAYVIANANLFGAYLVPIDDEVTTAAASTLAICEEILA
jgi:hypothetical protein